MTERLEWTPELVERFWTATARTKAGAHGFARNAGEFLVRLVEPALVTATSVLDFGAGDGDLVRHLIGRGLPTAAYEPNPVRRNCLMEAFRNEPGFLGVLAPSEDHRFDAIMMVEVIEHVLDGDLPATLTMLNHCMKPGGRLIVTTPNNEDLDLGLVVCPVTGMAFHRWQHMRSFTAESLGFLLADYGFEAEVVHQVQFSPSVFQYLDDDLFRTGRPLFLGDGSTLVYIGRKTADISWSGGQRRLARCNAVGEAAPPRPGFAGFDAAKVRGEIHSALAAARSGGAEDFVLVLPFVVPAFEALSLQANPRVRLLVLPHSVETAELERQPGIVRLALGDSQTPTLPATSETLVFVGPPISRYSQFFDAAATAGVRSVVHSADGDWTTSHIEDLRSRLRLRAMVRRTARSSVIAAATGARRALRAGRHFGHALGVGLTWPRRRHLAELSPLLSPDAFRAGSVIHVNSALAWGGAERQILNTLAGLRRRGANDLLLLLQRAPVMPDDSFFLPQARRFGIQIAIAGSRRGVPAQADCQRLSKVLRELRLMLPEAVEQEVLRFMTEFFVRRPRVVHGWQDSPSLTAGLAAALIGVPRIILSARNLNPTNFAYGQRYMAPAYRVLATLPNVVLANNSAAGAADYAKWLGLPVERFTVVRNGYDMREFGRRSPEAASAFRQQMEIPASAPLVGSVFRLYPEKGIELWLQTAALIAAEIPETQFVIIGTGPMRDDLVRRSGQLGLSERLHLPGTEPNLTPALSAFDVFLLCSRFEGTPNVVIEAQALGVPVVATDAGGTAEAVDTETVGRVERRRDAKALAAHVVGLLRDPAARLLARTHGPDFVDRRFSLERMIDETLALYDSGSITTDRDAA